MTRIRGSTIQLGISVLRCASPRAKRSGKVLDLTSERPNQISRLTDPRPVDSWANEENVHLRLHGAHAFELPPCVRNRCPNPSLLEPYQVHQVRQPLLCPWRAS